MRLVLIAVVSVCLLLAMLQTASAVPPPIPIEELTPKAEWVVIGKLGPLERIPGKEGTWWRHAKIHVTEVLKSPPGAEQPKTLTLETLDLKSERIGPVMYSAGTEGIWILEPRSKGVYAAPNLNSRQPLENRILVEKALDPTVKLLIVAPAPNTEYQTADYQTIGEAVEAADPGTHIRVHPGIYREGIVLKKSLDIVGYGPREQIVVQAADADCLRVEAEGGLIKGLTLRCRTGAKQPFCAVDIVAGSLVLEDCDISSNSLACLAVHGPSTNPTVRRCWIHDGNDAGVVFYDRCRGTLEDCSIFGNARAGVAIRKTSDPLLRRCRIHHGQAEGILVDRDGKGTLEACDVYRNAGTQVQAPLGWNARLHRCRVEVEEPSIDVTKPPVPNTN